jgi:hypothetical protein
MWYAVSADKGVSEPSHGESWVLVTAVDGIDNQTPLDAVDPVVARQHRRRVVLQRREVRDHALDLTDQQPEVGPSPSGTLLSGMKRGLPAEAERCSGSAGGASKAGRRHGIDGAPVEGKLAAEVGHDEASNQLQ